MVKKWTVQFLFLKKGIFMWLSKEEWQKKVKGEEKSFFKRQAITYMRAYLAKLIIDIELAYGNEEDFDFRNELKAYAKSIAIGLSGYELRQRVIEFEKILKDVRDKDGILLESPYPLDTLI